ncbi:DUF5777 family beta-barrel protein [Pseudotenacibaculum haliotis]|uniref:DUF5777 family beta-barrel protein n=1 Tax=Pseudotenacibaculum haliotis TaxID=1862138 RepID=A0ABW5LRR0_9FLAO
MRIRTIFLVALLSFGIVPASFAQDTLADILKKESSNKPFNTIATFKATRILLGHSVETRKKNVLEVSAMTRYWNTEAEQSNSFVADRMSARFGLEYGISDRLTFGAGFSSVGNIYDTFFKYRLLHQQENGGNKISITVLQTATYNSSSGSVYTIVPNDSFNDKLAFTTQLLIARKFTRNFSFQIAPTFIKRNTEFWPGDDQNHFALGFGARYKVSPHVSIASEYYYVANPIQSINTYNPFALGVNWEMSDLMLQFKLTHTPHFVEDAFITRSSRNFNFRDGNLFFGFHATYFIQL